MGTCHCIRTGPLGLKESDRPLCGFGGGKLPGGWSEGHSWMAFEDWPGAEEVRRRTLLMEIDGIRLCAECDRRVKELRK